MGYGLSLLALREPERVEMFVGPDGQETLVAKVNWEVEYDLKMSEIFAPMTMERIEQMVARWGGRATAKTGRRTGQKPTKPDTEHQ